MTAEELEPAEVQRLLRSAKRFADFGKGSPLLIVGAAKPNVIWANAAACAVLATTSRDRLTRVLFGASTNRTMIERLRRLRPGGPDHLERLALSSGFHVERLTLLSRAVDDERLGRVIVVQVAGGPVALPAEFEPELPAPPSPADPPPVLRGQAPTADRTAAEADPTPEEPRVSAWRTAEEVSADFTARPSAGRQARFVWELGPDGRLTAVGDGLADYVGNTAPRPGQRLDELLGGYAPEAAALLRTSWDERRSFSGLIVPWPVERSDARVAVVLGGAPLRGAASGFRGFGVVHVDQVSAAPQPEQVEPSPDEAAPVQSPAPQSEAPAPAPEEDALYLRVPDAEMEEIGLGGDEAGSSEPHQPASPPAPEPPQENSKVVHLLRFKGANQNTPGSPVPHRPVAALPPAEADQAAVLPPEPQWSESPGLPTVPAAQLSSTERSAFKEIARTLSGIEAAEAELPEADDFAPPESPVFSHQPLSVPEFDGSALLEKLPLGVLVTEGERIVFANEMLRGLLGFADLDGLAGSVGAAPLVGTAGRAGDASEIPRRVGLRAQKGTDLVVEAWTQAVPWHGASTAMTFVRPLDREEDGARMEAIRLDLARAQTLAQDFAEALDTAASGVGFLDATGRILSINGAAEQFFGYDQREVVGDTGALFVAPDEAHAWSAFLMWVTSGAEALGRVERRPFTGRRRSGEPIGLDVALKMLGDRRLSVVWQARQGEIDHDLDAARREAERASKRKSEFLAKVSHEIRTPLNAIIGFAEIMMEERFGPVGNGRYKDYLRDIHASGAHVMSLVNDLLDLSRIEAGRSDLKLVAVNANAIIGDCVGTLQSQAHRERVILRLSLAPRLPPILADERALRQIVLNLLSNAVKFNEPGGQVIVSTALTENESIAIRVRDTGLGMSEKDIETAMEPFRQLETPKASAGSGLGLPLTKALVEASRATMVIKSRPQEGTLVEVTFQRSQAEAVSVPAE